MFNYYFSFFWGLLPQPGDTLRFIFTKPLKIKKYLFRTGNYEHPSDKLNSNTTIEIAPVSTVDSTHYNMTSDGFITVGW